MRLSCFSIDHLSLLSDGWQPETWVAGVDEVGRGALFGPVVAAAVVLPIAAIAQLVELGVRDSKQLSAKRRSVLVPQIKAVVSAFQVSCATVQEIEQLNILQASLVAMRRSLLGLAIQPDLCLVDGKQAIPDLAIEQIPLIRGDARSPVIAAASILAKVWRDELMVELSQKYPEYDLAANKGYGTLKHRLALQQHGASPEHRLSFRLICQL
jgi:ribonuclease HII